MSDQRPVEPSRTRRSFIKRAAAAGASAAATGSLGASALTPAASGVASLDHVAVPMRQTAAMLRFYRSLGMTVREGDRICSVHCGDQKINFHRPATWQDPAFTLRAPGAQPPCGDFCFVWTGTSAALETLLSGVGAEIVEGPVERTGGRDGGTRTGTSRYTRDPDGNLLEFIIYPEGGDR